MSKRQIRKELNKVIEKALPDPELRKKVMALYAANPMLNSLMKQAGLSMSEDGVKNADPPELRLPDVLPPDGSHADK